MYSPLFAQLTAEAKQKLLKGNYKRLFDAGRKNVRAWEKAHAGKTENTTSPALVSGTRNSWFHWH
jgi:hypothetical protein